MTKRTAQCLIALVAILLSGFLNADGPKMENGRFAGGPVTILQLTETQLENQNISRVLKLTILQRRLLESEFGLSPSYLEVWNTKDGESDCTCFAWNLAFRFDDLHVEVPHKYLVSDSDAERRQARLDAID